MFGHEYSLQNEVDLRGIFLAKVISINDPKALERIRVRVLGVHDMDNEDPKNSIWCQHCAASKSNSGEVPDVDDFVYIMFLHGNPSACIWLGWARVIKG